MHGDNRSCGEVRRILEISKTEHNLSLNFSSHFSLDSSSLTFQLNTNDIKRLRSDTFVKPPVVYAEVVAKFHLHNARVKPRHPSRQTSNSTPTPTSALQPSKTFEDLEYNIIFRDHGAF